MTNETGTNFVFLDSRGRRWQRLRWIAMISFFLVFLAAILFVQSLWVKPQLIIPASVHQLKERLRILELTEQNPPQKPSVPLWTRFVKPDHMEGTGTVAREPSRKSAREAERIVLGIHVSWSQESLLSLKTHARGLTHFSTDWFTVQDGTGKLTTDPDMDAVRIAQASGLALLPVLDNLTDDTWHPEAVENLASGPKERRRQFIESLTTQLKQCRATGVLVDWEQLDPSYQKQVSGLVSEMAASLHDAGLQLWLHVPIGMDLKVFDLEALSGHIDRFVAALHDENTENDSPGPVASREWVKGWLEAMVQYGEPSQWIAVLGTYGYDWGADNPHAETLSFRDTMTRAGKAGIPSLRLQSPSGNPWFNYDDDGVLHNVWFLDAVTFYNQLRFARDLEVGGIGVASLGYEDEGVWKVLADYGRGLDNPPPQDLETIHSEVQVAHVGQGEFLTFDESRGDGRRRLELEPSSGDLQEEYTAFPSTLTVSHQGKGNPDQVALTFDDGPDPEWTPVILDLLRQRGARACFFILGSKAESYPELVARIVAEGHELGIHTYTHPDLSRVSEERLVLELNATQRLAQFLTGRSTILFRPPYGVDSRPASIEQIAPLILAQRLGYVTVTDNIDPEDWAKPGAEAILQRVKHQRRLGGNIVLLHDAGGDRSQTLEALPHILEYLEARGDSVVPLSTLLGEARDYIMPVLDSHTEPMPMWVSGGGFTVMHAAESFLWSFMIVATALTLCRTLIICTLAWLNLRKGKEHDAGDYAPPVSVIIAAYNEERVIGLTLRSLLRSVYAGAMEILVIDDGSTDRTAQIVKEYAAEHARVRLLQQGNQGKAIALRRGLAGASHEILITLDADTIFQPDTIAHLVQPLQDARVGAVSGHARVGNNRTFLGKCQSLEYSCGFNLDRRAYDHWNCITVVPGAVSAFRKSAVLKAGGFSTDTLAEDTDLTLCLHRLGYIVRYAPRAIAYTEAPETIGGLSKQRFRWAFGTLQCLWKNHDLVFSLHHRTLGWFSLPNMWFFHVLLVAFAPIVDLLLLISLIAGTGGIILTYFIFFLAMDLAASVMACIMEKIPLRASFLIIPMRFIYRPLLSWVIWKSIFRALKGAWVSWGKLERSASVAERI